MTPALGVWTAGVWIVTLGVGFLNVRSGGPPALIVLGAVAVGVFEYFRVISAGYASQAWASSFLELGLIFALGPVAAAANSVAIVVGQTLRASGPWYRSALTLASVFLYHVAAWDAYILVLRATNFPLLAGFSAGIAFAVGGIVFCGVQMQLDYKTLSIRGWLRECAVDLLYMPVLGAAAIILPVAYAGGGIAGVWAPILLVGLVQASSVHQDKRVRDTLRAQQQTAEERERRQAAELAAAQRGLEAGTRERARIGADLHDGPINDLVALRMTLWSLTKLELPADKREALEEAVGLTDTAEAGLRTAMSEIAPTDLTVEKLGEHLAGQLAKVDKLGAVTYLECPADLPLTLDQAKLVFRIVQEAIRNILKHAQPNNVWVELKSIGGSVHATIADDGHGFDEETWARQRAAGHAGITYLTDTAADGGAHLEILSTPGHGTMMEMFFSDSLVTATPKPPHDVASDAAPDHGEDTTEAPDTRTPAEIMFPLHKPAITDVPANNTGSDV
jgi:signal transduction histidine kinase